MSTNVLEADIRDRSKATNAVAAGTVGNLLEWYDFAVYAFLVPTISALFFPAETELLSILYAFAAFGVGFLARPFGAILFGIYGDRVGRRTNLAAISILMGIATLAIGLMPTYDSIGIWATVGLVVARLLQGLSAGGEYGGAIPFLVEFAPPRKRGAIGSWQQVGNGLGLLLGSVFAFALSYYLSPEALKEWGWRLPFILGVLPAIVGLYMRLRLPDTPAFEALESNASKAVSPLKLALTEHFRPILMIAGIVLQLGVGFYLVLTFMPTYLGLVTELPRNSALMIVSIGLVVYAAVSLIAGSLSDRLGRKPLLLFSAAALLCLYYPLFKLASGGSFAQALVAEMLLAALVACAGGPIAAICAELAPAKVRSTVVSLGVAAALTIFGGFAPFIATFLMTSFGTPLAPAFYGMAAAALSLLVILKVRETAFEPLR